MKSVIRPTEHRGERERAVREELLNHSEAQLNRMNNRQPGQSDKSKSKIEDSRKSAQSLIWELQL